MVQARSHYVCVACTRSSQAVKRVRSAWYETKSMNEHGKVLRLGKAGRRSGSRRFHELGKKGIIGWVWVG